MPPKSSRARGGAKARGGETRRKRKGSVTKAGSGTVTPITPAAALAMEAVPAAAQEATEQEVDPISFLPFKESLTPRYTAKDLNEFIDRGNPRNPHRKQVCLLCKYVVT